MTTNVRDLHTPQTCPWAAVVATMLEWAGGEAEITDLEMFSAQSKELYSTKSVTNMATIIGVRKRG